MTKKEIRDAGRERGWNAASWTDLPVVGTKVPRGIDWIGYGVVTRENAGDVFALYAGEAESNGRQYADFNVLAQALNDVSDTKPYDPWAVLEDGIAAGITANWRKRKTYYND